MCCCRCSDNSHRPWFIRHKKAAICGFNIVFIIFEGFDWGLSYLRPFLTKMCMWQMSSLRTYFQSLPIETDSVRQFMASTCQLLISWQHWCWSLLLTASYSDSSFVCFWRPDLIAKINFLQLFFGCVEELRICQSHYWYSCAAKVHRRRRDLYWSNYSSYCPWDITERLFHRSCTPDQSHSSQPSGCY